MIGISNSINQLSASFSNAFFFLPKDSFYLVMFCKLSKLKWKNKNLDEMEECMEGAITQEAGDYFRTIQTLQVPTNNDIRNK